MLISSNVNVEFAEIKVDKADGTKQSVLVTDKEPTQVRGTETAQDYDRNGSAVTEINHSHPLNTNPSGYSPTGEVDPIQDDKGNNNYTGDAKGANTYPVNSKGDPILRGVYKPAYQSIQDMMQQKWNMLKAISILILLCTLYSCFALHKKKFINELDFLISDYKSDFNKYKFFESSKCKALLIYFKSTPNANNIIIQNMPLQNFYVYFNTEDTSKSNFFGVYDHLPIFLVSNTTFHNSLKEFIRFDTIYAKDFSENLKIKNSRTPLEYEPVLISTYNLKYSLKTLKLQNDSILKLKIKIK